MTPTDAFCPIRSDEPSSDAHARAILEAAHTIAVLGVHVEPARAAHYVPEYLAQHGYRILPVNPAFVGRELFGAKVVASLGDIEEPVDIVDVFRRSDAVIDHVDEVLGMRHKPKVVWLQLGIRNDQAAERWLAAGIDVVQDRCTLADHRRLVGRVDATK